MATKDATRQAILQTARDLFDRYGPIKTSVADIARQLGMSAANIYNFYPSRDAIIEAVGSAELAALKHQLATNAQHAEDDWTRIKTLFLTTARYIRDHLQDEKDILQLQLLERTYQWKFISDFHQFLRDTTEATLRHGMAHGVFRRMEPVPAGAALMDCLMTALDPLIIAKLDRADHERRLHAQLDLLEHAFSPPGA